MLRKGRKLESEKEAVKFNSDQRGCLLEFAGCIDSLACEKCCQVWVDSICCCGGIVCPDCGWSSAQKQESVVWESKIYDDLIIPDNGWVGTGIMTD